MARVKYAVSWKSVKFHMINRVRLQSRIKNKNLKLNTYTAEDHFIFVCQFYLFHLPTQGSIMDSELQCPRTLRCYVIEFPINSFALREDYQGK